MAGRIERTYGRFFRLAIRAIKPIRRAITEAECDVHKFINIQALDILKNDRFLDACLFFSDYIEQINLGVVWADSDLKNTSHFYNPAKLRGLLGNGDALALAEDYYEKALRYWYMKDNDRSMFYLGAAVHLVQDMTIPQHANIRLLDNHRRYENFIKRTYIFTPRFKVDRGGYYLSNIQEYIRCNARMALKIYRKLRDIEENRRRFYTIAKFTLPLAQKTTAGCFMMFYKDVGKKKRLR